jgi:hypothetical protein
MADVYLPEDLLSEILNILPLKTVLRRASANHGILSLLSPRFFKRSPVSSYVKKQIFAVHNFHYEVLVKCTSLWSIQRFFFTLDLVVAKQLLVQVLFNVQWRGAWSFVFVFLHNIFWLHSVS